MERVRTTEVAAHAGERVRVAGWLQAVRKLGGIAFLLVRDGWGTVQVVAEDPALLARLETERVHPESDVAIEGLDVEAQLAEVLGTELADLELDGHEAREPAVEEDEVDREVLVADLHRVLGADEAEVAAELGEEAAQVVEEGAVKIRFGVAGGEVEKLQGIQLLEVFDGAGVQFSQRC